MQLFPAVPTAGYAVALLVLLVKLTLPITVFLEGNVVTSLDAVGGQASMSPTNPILNVGPVEPPPPVLPGTKLLYKTLSVLALPYFCKPATH